MTTHCATSGRHHKSRRPAAGFTLIELLLAMGMAAMLTLALYVGLYTAFRARESMTAQTDAMRHAKAALDLVEQNLRSILPPTATAVLSGPFVGTPGGTADAPAATIDCYTLGSDFIVDPAATDGDGPRHVQMLLEADTSSAALVRYMTRNPIDTSATPVEDVLARDVVGFGAQYFDGTNWTDTWDSTQQSNALPLAVELTAVVKAPTKVDPAHLYRLTRIVTLSCGQTPDQAAALVAAAGPTAAAAGGTQ